MKDLNFPAIGEKLRDIRKSKGLTQEYVADAVDVNVSHISNIERGIAKVSLTLLVQLCDFLDTSVDYVLQNEYSHPTNAVVSEIVKISSSMPKEKQETLLRISKAL